MKTSEATAPGAKPVTRPIRTVREFEHAVAELDRWAEIDPAEGTAGYDRMELLGILVGAYEEANLPRFRRSTPQDLVEFMAEQRGLTAGELAGIFGGRSRLSEFMNRKRELSKAQIVRLREELGIPADLLLA